MTDIGTALQVLPSGLRKELIDEFQDIVSLYQEGKWRPSELSAGRFCEIVYSIVNGHRQGSSYPVVASKPADFAGSCRALENDASLPRSFRLLIARVLPVLYEVRNNRNVGHVGGDVDPNKVDAAFLCSVCSWVMAELIRVLYGSSLQDAQQIVDSIGTRQTPLVWDSGSIKRILDPSLSLKDQVLVLLASCPGSVSLKDLECWIEFKSPGYSTTILKQLHAKRMVEFDKVKKEAAILPPGTNYVSELLKKKLP